MPRFFGSLPPDPIEKAVVDWLGALATKLGYRLVKMDGRSTGGYQKRPRQKRTPAAVAAAPRRRRLATVESPRE